MNQKGKSGKGTYFISSLSAITSITEFGVGLIFILFLINGLHFSNPLASVTYAHVFIFVYLMPIVLGFVQDKYLNSNISLHIGFIASIISQIFLFCSASMYVPSAVEYNTIIFNTQNMLFFTGMLFFAIGISFVNLSFSHMTNSINTDDTQSLNAFSILYSLINLGSATGTTIMTIMVGNNHFTHFKWGFLAFAICLLIGYISYMLLKGRLLVDNEGQSIEEKSSLDYTAIRNNLNLFVLKKIIAKTKVTRDAFANMDIRAKLNTLRSGLSKHEKDRMQIFFVFIAIIIIFRIAFYQCHVSMVFLIESYVKRDLGFYIIPIQMFLIINPLLVFIFTPWFVKFNNALDKRNIELGLTKRIAIGMLFMALAFITLSIPGYLLDMNCISHINCIWIVVFLFFVSCSEMFLSITGYSVVSQLAPENYLSVFFGIFLSVRAFAMFFSGIISQFFPKDLSSVIIIGKLPLNGLLHYYSLFIAMTLICAVGLFIFKNRINKKMHLEDLKQ